MQFSRRRSVQLDSGRRGRPASLETLESRVLLSGAGRPIPAYMSAYVPSDLKVSNPITGRSEMVSVQQMKPKNLLTNEGKIVSGTDREGDAWTITVHGPGKVIVTDTTPNDGTLNDDINTIQFVGTSIRNTYVTAFVVASNRSQANLVDASEGQSDERILFNRIIANSGVHSIQLNGFILTRGVWPQVAQPTGITLRGGVRVLSFDSIDGLTDSSVTTDPIEISIGDASNPLPAKIQPSIYLNSIWNTVYDGDSTAVPTTPLTTPNVAFRVNGTIRDFSIVSAGQHAVPGAYQFQFPVVGTTGRTSVQAAAVRNLDVIGSAVNVTASRSEHPFQNGTGLRYLRNARFGGTPDALGLDVNGRINRLSFEKGVGNPTGVFTGKDSAGRPLPATSYGINQGSQGYPGSGYMGGLVRARSIGRIHAGPADVRQQTPQNPLFDQLAGPKSITYVTQPGSAVTSTAIVTSGSIDDVHILGDQVNSEIKTGFDYGSYAAGLEGTRAASRIRHLNQQGSLVNSVDSATVRPNADGQYRHGSNRLGRGAIRGKVSGGFYNTGGTTALGNTGAGVFARVLSRRIRVKR